MDTASVENRDILKSIMSPSEDEAFIASTLKQLSENGKWLAVSLLVTGRHLGPKTCLDNFAHNCAAKSISVGRLLKCLKIDELKSWGMSLAIALLKNKASLDTIEECFGSPVLHTGVQLALSTGMTDLVEIALKRFTNIDKKLQEKDENGKTAYQLLLQCPDKHSQTYARLDILLKDHIRHEGAQAIHAPMGISTTQSDGKGKDECQENRMLANKFFKEGKYSKAISFYKKTISHTTSKQTLAVLYGNLAECCIRLKQFSDAIEYGEKSIEYDTSLTKTKETTESDRSASYLDILLSFDANGHLNTSLYDKRDNFSFHMTSFPFMRSSIPSSPAYCVFVYQLIRYARACSKYKDFIIRARRLARMSLKEMFNIVKTTVLRDEDLMFDKRGDTLFHLIVSQNDHDFAFKMHLCQELVNIGMAKYLDHRNKEGRVAISYVMGNPRLRQFLKFHMPKDLPKKTNTTKQRSNASGIESPFGTDESKQNLIQLSKKLKQKSWYTDEEENNIIDGIIQRIQGRIPDNDISSLTSLPVKYFSRILEALLLGNKTTELLILWRRSRRKMSGIPVKFAKNFSVTTCFHKSTFMSETEQIAFLEACINGGAQDDLETEEDKRRFMQESISLDRHHICLFLIKRGINPRFYVKDEKSPLFLALSRALETGECELLEHLLTLYLKDKKLQFLDPNQQDSQGKSLFHEVCCFDGPIENAIRVCKLLNRHKVKGAMIDQQGKAPKDYLSKGDEREKYLNVPSDKRIQKQKEETHERIKEQPDRSGTTTNQRMDHSNKTETDNIMQIGVSSDVMKQNRKEEINQKTKELLKYTNKTFLQQPDHSSTILYQHIGHIDKKEIDDLLPSARDLPTDSDINKRMDKAYGQEPMPEQESSLDETDSSKEEDENEEEIYVVFIDPDKVVNSFPALDEQIKMIENSIAKIKPLDKTKQTTSKGSRDLQADRQLNFECTDIEEEIMEMIETGSAWQVELAPEAVSFLRNSFVDRVIRLKTLHEILQLTSKDRTQCEAKLLMKKDFILYQSFFHESEQIIWEKAITYLPSQRTEIHVQYDRMYSQVIRIWNVLTSDKRLQTVVRKLEKVKRNSRKCTQQRKLVKNPSKISGGERDLPSVYHKIEETASESCHLQFAPLAISKRGEYNLIKFQNLTQELIQIILRDPEREATFPFNVLETEHEIIEMDLSIPIVLQGRSGTGKTTCCLYRLWKLFVSYWKDWNYDEGSTRKSPTDQSGNLGQDSYSLNPDEDFADHAAYIEDEEPSLHQLFVTKSPFLCQQVREQLNLLMNGVDRTKEHIETTKQPLPYQLEDLGPYHYPLVLNSHQFLLMLDASLGKEYFFDRNEDLSLEYEIPGWTYRTSEGIVADSDDSEDDFDDEDIVKGKSKDHNTDSKKKSTSKKSKSSKMREVTYEVFERDVWPKIKNKASREIKCHPSMVWKEIVSFIRGSYECMLPESKGCLSLEEYIKVGRKKAPDFDTEDRKIVYELFKLYERHKRKMNYFDETDVIRFIVQRIHSSSDYEHLLFDQIYVDETQDFTLAELWLLVKFCSNPSQMFLAGDTAQAIMHGVSFRFSDLVSLFQLFDEKYKESLKDLLLLLKSKQQKIEFGAHQVILVLDEESKKHLPEQFKKAITLTIPESKGLEFDDVLVFNFFKDSKSALLYDLLRIVITKKLHQDQFGDRVFTKKTSKEEWIRQGEKLMRRKIYHEAVKCFVNGKNKEMTELALAFHQMIKADK
ncbi:hypothetical protein FSP39_016548 [Pinctada imbricata]|uniref:UvrD-like helicase ATP-binding domain-containing protein n=1 Tax=Pinctada imbricata TaxID=66713 RepID=A0AA89BZB5_PINIB|nr:hypothetical protein FSP39_016548 [Pinctada imbricata]